MGIKTKVFKWAKKIGHKEAKDRLMAAGLKYSATTKLITGNYGPEPKAEMTIMINEAMEMEVHD